MKVNKWTIGLAAAGLVSLPSGAQSEEKASPLMTALSSTTIGGYVSSSIWWVPGTGNANLPGFAYGGPAKADGFNLDVVKLSIERPLDEGQWSAGYKADVLFGPDANALATTSTGTGNATSDFAIKQAYVALRAPAGNGLDLKLGVWDTIIGYETFDSGNNPNYTRSYGYTIEPTTHTGLLATYQLSEMLGIAAGIANTFGPTINGRAHPPTGPKAESYKTYMGSIAFTAPESMGFMQGSTLYAGFINGFDSAVSATGDDRTHWYLGGTVATPVTGLKLGASMDYTKADIEAPTANDNPYVGAYAAYLSFAASEKLSVHGRMEYANSDTAVLGASKVFALTGTVQYDLWKNVLSRLEARWDHSASGDDAYGGSTVGLPTKKNNFIFAANLVYKF
jgi:putative OmpL-like beta-barrel porin-2